MFEKCSSSADEDFLICLNVLLKACEEKFIEIVFPCKLRRVFTSTVGTSSHGSIKFFSGCDQTDTKNLYCDGAGSITVLQINAVLGTYDDNAKKYKDIDLSGTTIDFPFQVTVGRTNNLGIDPYNFKVTVTSGKTVTKYSYPDVTLKGLSDPNLENSATASGTVSVTLPSALKDGDKLVLTYVPDKTYAEYSMNWTFTKKAAETTTATK